MWHYCQLFPDLFSDKLVPEIYSCKKYYFRIIPHKDIF